MTTEIERAGNGRRKADENCPMHEARLDDMDAELHKQSGWFKASAAFMTVAVMCISGFGNVILTKLTSIESLLSESKVTLMQHSEQIKALDCRVKDIEDRHRYQDQLERTR